MKEFSKQKLYVRNIPRILSILIHIACFSGALYIAIYEIQKYYKNEDSSNTHMKRFGGHGWNSFPAITLCFQSGDSSGSILAEGLFNKSNIETTLGISAGTYRDVLLGKVHHENIRKIMDSDFEANTMNLRGYLKKFRIQDANENEYKWEYGENLNDPTFEYISNYPSEFNENKNVMRNDMPLLPKYLDPKIKCFTHHPNINDDISVDSLDFYFNISKLESIKDGKMYIYAHKDNQFIRDMKYIHKLRYFTDVNRQNSNNQIVFDLMYIRIIKNREDAKEKCNEDLENDDQEWMRQVISHISCIPSYWRTVYGDDNNNETCKLKSDLEKASWFLPFKNEHGRQLMLGRYKKPCQRMRVLANTNTDKDEREGVLKIKFRFRYYIVILENFCN